MPVVSWWSGSFNFGQMCNNGGQAIFIRLGPRLAHPGWLKPDVLLLAKNIHFLRMSKRATTLTTRILMICLLLSQDHTVFPVSLTVVRISGLGLDSIYMGIMKAYTAKDDGIVKVWALPNGTTLCCDQNFKDAFGIGPDAVLGRSLGSLTTNPEEFDQ